MSEIMTVYITSWDRLAEVRVSNGRIIQVSREKPSNIEVDSKHHTAVPTQKLVDRYKNDLINEDGFETRYVNYLSERQW